MNAKTVVSLAIAIALGVAATLIGRNIIQGNRAAGASSKAVTQIVVAAADLEPGRLIVRGDVALKPMPSELVTSTMVRDADVLVGRAVLAPVVKGQAMFDGLLAPPGTEGGLSGLVPDGMRAVSVEVNESSAVAGLIAPGCRVDVIASIRGDAGAQMARTIVGNAKVQAVNRQLSRSGAADDKGAVKTVTLIVTPKDAEAIELASNMGRLRLVLRGSKDSAELASSGLTFSELIGRPEADAEATLPEPEAPRASAPAGPMQSVRIIRGNSESTVHYELKARQGTNQKEWTLASPSPAGGMNNGAQPNGHDPFANGTAHPNGREPTNGAGAN